MYTKYIVIATHKRISINISQDNAQNKIIFACYTWHIKHLQFLYIYKYTYITYIIYTRLKQYNYVNLDLRVLNLHHQIFHHYNVHELVEGKMVLPPTPSRIHNQGTPPCAYPSSRLPCHIIYIYIYVQLSVAVGRDEIIHEICIRYGDDAKTSSAIDRVRRGTSAGGTTAKWLNMPREPVKK